MISMWIASSSPEDHEKFREKMDRRGGRMISNYGAVMRSACFLVLRRGLVLPTQLPPKIPLILIGKYYFFLQ